MSDALDRRAFLVGLGMFCGTASRPSAGLAAEKRSDSAWLQEAVFRAVISGDPVRLPERDLLVRKSIMIPRGARLRLVGVPGTRIVGSHMRGEPLFTGPHYSVALESPLEFANCRTAFHLASEYGSGGHGLEWDLRDASFADFGYAALHFEGTGESAATIDRLDLSGCSFSARKSDHKYFPFDVLQHGGAPPISLLVASHARFERGGRESLRLNSSRNREAHLSGCVWKEYVNPGRGKDADAHFYFNRSGRTELNYCRFTGLRPLNKSVAMNDSEAIRGGGSFMRIENCVFEDAGSSEACLSLKGCEVAEIRDTVISFTRHYRDAIAATSGSRRDCSGILAPRQRLELSRVQMTGGNGAAIDFEGKSARTVLRGDLALRDWGTLEFDEGSWRPLYSSGSAIRVSGREHDIDLTVNVTGPSFPRIVLSQEGGSARAVRLAGDLAAFRAPTASHKTPRTAVIFLNHGAKVDMLQLNGKVDATGMKRLLLAEDHPEVGRLVWLGEVCNLAAREAFSLRPDLIRGVTHSADIKVKFIFDAAPTDSKAVIYFDVPAHAKIINRSRVKLLMKSNGLEVCPKSDVVSVSFSFVLPEE